MGAQVEDRIERDVLIAAPLQRVWDVITEPVHMGTWFGMPEPTSADFRPGGWVVFDHEEFGEIPVLIEEIEAPRRFSYWWALVSAGKGTRPTEGNRTLVTFTLTEEGDGTRLRVVESGITQVRAEDAELEARFKDNTEGWAIVTEDLRKRVEEVLSAAG